MPVATKRILKKLKTEENLLLRRISREDIRLVYTFDKRLGSGSFGTVRIAHKTSVDPDKQFAVKSIKRQ